MRLASLLLLVAGCGRAPTDDTGAPDACAADLAACDYLGQGLAYEEVVAQVDDPVTGRSLPLLARVPEGDGPFPVVIWSHGGGFNPTGHRLATHWGHAIAEHGYVVLHIGHVPVTGDQATALCDLGGVPPADCVVEQDEDANGMVAFVKTRDVIAVLDALPDLSEASVAQRGAAIDLDRVAVGGWSAGARAPLLTHGAVVSLTDSVPRFDAFTDTRPIAAIATSPMGPGYGGFFQEDGEDSWQGMRGPVFMATGDNDIKPTKPDVSGLDRRVAFTSQPADGERWLLYSRLEPGVGGHPTYDLADLESDDERLSRFSRALRSGVLAFLDAHVRDDADGEAWLASDAAAVLAGEADWEHR